MITRYNKASGKAETVTVELFLAFVGSGAKTRERALSSLIEGNLYQDLNEAFYILPIREAAGKKGLV